jgi:outer membrane receptor protein involved in Fe transport
MTISKITLAMAGIATALIGPMRLFAADTAAPSTELETITVTAQKRSESEQTVPLSMTTFSSAVLEEKGINNFFDYATKVPNLAFAPTGDGVGTARTVSIRGISGDNVTGFYIDDTPLPDSLDPRVLDIDHIEVLRGPQGTLYGARSMGGLVRIVTKDPNLSTSEGSVHGGLSYTERTNQPNWTFDGVFNMPIVQDRAALRLSFFGDDQAGYLKRSFCTDPAAAIALTCTPLAASGITTVNNVGDVNSYGVAAALTVKPNDDLTITPRLMQQRTKYNGFPMADYRAVPGNGFGYPVAGVPALPALPRPLEPSSFTQARTFDIPEGGYDAWALYSIAVDWKTGFGELVSSTSYFTRKVDEIEDESDFVYAGITSYFGGTPQPGSIEEIKDYQRFVEEVRFASDFKGPVQFVAGGFYSDFHGRLPFGAYYPGATVPGLDQTLIGGPGELTPGFPNLIFASDYHTEYKEPAVFGEVSYQPFDPLKLTGGLRWYQVKTTAYGYQAGLATGGGPPIVDAPVTTTENGVNPKFEADYHLTADDMIYVNAAKGFRPGGLVPSVPAGTPGTNTDCVAALQQIGANITIQDTRSFKSDSLWSYELGTKTSWLDRRLTFNAAAFYIKWSRIQQEILLNCGFQYRANAGAAESKGGEMELHAKPVEALEFSLGVGYQNAKITESSASSPQKVGSPVYQTPDWTGNGSVTYTTQLTSDWKLIGGTDYSYIGRSFSANNDAADPRLRGSYRLINASLAFARDKFQVALVGKNLANEVADLGDNRSIAAEVPGRPRLFVNQPRTLGVEFRSSF